jgi:ubiquinol-cytochrome c reductase iron-sulfur subunit
VEPPRRRDLLTTVAFATAGVGATLALWPFIAAMNPDAETIAKRKTFDVLGLNGTERATIGVAGRPVLIFRRSPDELNALRDSQSDQFKDRDSDRSIQPPWAKNWHRSLKPEIMVCVGNCTHEGCLVMKRPKYDPLLVCPCCGARYDLAGRALAGPVLENLRVPPYRFIDATTIEFIEAEVLTRPSPANPA